jgi:DNA-binding MarR family transcriptional regulator
MDVRDLDLIERALELLVRMSGSRRVHNERAAMAGVDISQLGYALLCRIQDEGPLSLHRLANLTHIDPSVVGRQVRLLEAAGLVARRPDPRDSRAVLVSATAKGRDVRRRMFEVFERHMLEVLSQWSERDVAKLAELLSRLVDDMRRVRLPALDDGG